MNCGPNPSLQPTEPPKDFTVKFGKYGRTVEYNDAEDTYSSLSMSALSSTSRTGTRRTISHSAWNITRRKLRVALGILSLLSARSSFWSRAVMRSRSVESSYTTLYRDFGEF